MSKSRSGAFGVLRIAALMLGTLAISLSVWAGRKTGAQSGTIADGFFKDTANGYGTYVGENWRTKLESAES